MSQHGWGGSAATAVAVAGGSGAAQLGLGYGLGIIVWRSSGDPAGDSTWLASLAWTIWIAASSTIAGALVADRMSTGDSGAPPRWTMVDGAPTTGAPGTGLTLAWRVVLPVAAALGALVTLPLVAIPARDIHRAETYTPEVTAGGYALVGVILGLVVAVGVLSSRAAMVNVVATAGWLWLLALATVVQSLATRHASGTAPLAVWRFATRGWSIHGSLYVWDVLMMLGAAVLIGALAAWRPSHRRDNRIGVTLSGACGPLLVAVAYFLAAPSLTPSYFLSTPRILARIPDAQLSAYLIAPYAVIAGLAGSALTTIIVDRTILPRRVDPAAAPAATGIAPGTPATAPAARAAAPEATTAVPDPDDTARRTGDRKKTGVPDQDSTGTRDGGRQAGPRRGRR